MALRLVVGLGNPGQEYSRTRHNVGFMAAERIAGDAADWRDFERGLGLWTRTPSLLVAKPMTYMNESGRFVQRFAAYYKIEPQEMLIVYDDVALPLGRIRIRANGSSGGQKGMKSIIDRLGTQDVPRLRLGIGPQPAYLDSAAFVLRRFSGAEKKALDEALDKALAAINDCASHGLEEAMNRYNPKA